jgi:hypothetical protein
MQRRPVIHRTPRPCGAPAAPPRRGAATVELAVVLPVFLTLLLGLAEMSSALNATHVLHGAVRDAGRLASMDYKQFLAAETDPNTKVVQDIRNLLCASGLPGDLVTIRIVHAGGSNDGQPFDLANPSNYLKDFRIEASVPYTAVSGFPVKYMNNQDIAVAVTFRKGRVSLSGTN